MPELLDAECFRLLYHANAVGVAFLDRDQILDGNDAFLASIGARRDDLQRELSLTELLEADTKIDESFADGVAREFDITRLDLFPGHILVTGLSPGPGTQWLAVVVDLTKRVAAERAIRHLALHDPVTGLPNRRLLFDRLEHAISRATRQSKTVGILFCDLDSFMEINDQYGHRAGDAVLQTVAHRLQAVVRDDDTVARVGGDEFVVIIEELADTDHATRVAERARVAVSQDITFEGRELRVTASVGVSIAQP
ncbi:MAG TPA: GGDEF domain-containing protein, partial [Acidimicrobiia bacterium]|nr:GGDEF domain-containing protein [Acidimicrobiia bacterium]